ncbi:natural cytotoxicity triggering receptor 1 [Ctenodactylus gundi]
MAPSTLAALFCLGLCQSQQMGARKEILSKPTIWAEPGALVPEGKPVTIWCQGPRGAAEFQLHFEGGFFASDIPWPPGQMCRGKFRIPAMSYRKAGQYSCFYRKEALWSEPSDPLGLVLTGIYDTPTLWVHPGPEVTLGEMVTFYCRLENRTTTFILLKEGEVSRAQPRWHQQYGSAQAGFPVGPVTTAHQGTYRCFSSYNSHMWSFPSQPVELQVTGNGTASLAPADPTTLPDSGPWNLSIQNLLRLGLALLVLLALVWFLAEDWFMRRRARERQQEVPASGCRRQWGTRGPPGEGRSGQGSPEEGQIFLLVQPEACGPLLPATAPSLSLAALRTDQGLPFAGQELYRE